MRKSVKAKQTAQQRERQHAHLRTKRLAMWLSVIFIGSLGLFALSFASWHANQQIKTASAQINTDQQQTEQYRQLAKINTAKKAEAAAKAKIEAEMAAQKESERTLAATSQTEPPASSKCDVTDPTSITVIINKKHCFNPADWAPADLSDVGGYPLRLEAARQMTAMMQAASAAGNGFSLSSAYRSYQNQKTVYDNWVQVNGSVSAADTVSARPGYSEHQTGLAADLQTPGCALECFAGGAAYTWLTQHAAEYGFINRYPVGLSAITGYAPEAWHWRYVGVTTAQDMKTKGIQTLEQYFGVTGGSY